MWYMFDRAEAFNGNIEDWDTGKSAFVVPYVNSTVQYEVSMV